MQYSETVKDLFTVPKDYMLCQCISADFAMGKGIALQFNHYFNIKKILRAKYKSYVQVWDSQNPHGNCLMEGRVFNLITKRNYWEKPTYETLGKALTVMKTMILLTNKRKIAMPKIACGLDGLQWDRVRRIIKEIFKDTDVEILVCKDK